MENNSKEMGYILQVRIMDNYKNFLNDYLKTLGDEYEYTPAKGDFGILVKNKNIVKKYAKFAEDNIEKLLDFELINHERYIALPMWIFTDSLNNSELFKEIKNNLQHCGLINEARLYYGIVGAEKGIPLAYLVDANNYWNTLTISTLLYYNALTNAKYADTIRRIFKYYGKECIYKAIQANKPTEQKLIEFVSSMLGEMVDVFDESIKPDKEPKEVQDLFLDVLSTGGKLIDEFIQDHNESKLDEKLKKLMADAANKYAELTASGGTQQQSKSSPESNTDSDIETPQLDYDEEFNSAPKYDDLEAYTAFIKQQNRQIVEDYARKKEMEMQKENTIETTATVDANGKVLYVAKDEAPQYICIADYILKNNPCIYTKDPNTGKKGFTFFNYKDIADLYKASKKVYYMVANGIMDMIHSEAMKVFLSYEPNPVFSLSKLSNLKEGEMLFFTPSRRFVIRGQFNSTANKYEFKLFRIDSHEEGEKL